MKIPQNTNKYSAFAAPLIFLTAVFLFYPLLYPRIFLDLDFPHNINLFTIPTITLLSIILLFFSNKRLWTIFRNSWILLLFTALFLVIAFFQLIRIKNYDLGNLCSALFYLAVPLFAMAYKEELTALLPRIMTAFWFLNIGFIAGNTILKKTIAPFGLPGNANWNAVLLIITTLWALYLLSTAKWQGLFAKAYFMFICGLLTITGAWCLFRCSSRAALLALGITGVTAAYLEFGYKYRKACLIVLLTLTAGIAVFATLPAGNSILTERIAEDVRIPLWEGCIKLITDNWMTGTTPSLFESEFAPYVPEDYFMRDNSAVRCNHPHNHFLFFAAAFGLILFPLWLFLLFCPLWKFLKTYAHRKRVEKIIFYSFIILLIHSMFDLVLYEWPTNVIGMIFLGILWGLTTEVGSETTEKAPHRKLVFVTAGIVLAFFLAIELRNDLKASLSYRNALISLEKEPDGATKAAASLDKALGYKENSPQLLYKAAMNAFYKLENREMALRYLKTIRETTPVKNYAHSNGFIGLILCGKGQFRDGLRYLDQEAENYPLSTIIRYYQFAALQQLGEKAAADNAYAAMLETLKLKGLTINDLPEILNTPEYDSHPRKLLEKRAKQSENKSIK